MMEKLFCHALQFISIWKEYPCDIQTHEDWMKQWDMSDENDKEYYEFKMKHMVEVDPNTYKKEAA